MSRKRKLGDPDAFAASGGPEWYAGFSAHMHDTRIRYSETLDMVCAMLDADLAAKAGYSSPESYLADIQRLSLRHARQLISHARQVCQTTTPTGHQRPAPLPTVREALAHGAVSADQVDEIVKVVAEIPDWAPTELRELVEKTLVAEAQAAGPAYVRAAGRELIARIDPDGTSPREKDLAEPKNIFRYHRTSRGGMTFTGEIEPEAAEKLDGLLSALGKPQHPSDTIRDERTITERHGDAFCAIVYNTATAPAEGGERPNINVTLDYHKLMAGIGTATFELGDPIPACAVRRLACDANLIPMVLNTDSVPLTLGDTFRVVPTKQRKALIVRDKGCAMPGCTTNGLPEFIPPAYLDPTQTPLRNTLHRQPL